MDRQENSAEHSWQVILAAIVLSEHSNSSIDLLKVVKMLALHDIPEIIMGDTLHYSKLLTSDSLRLELESAKKIFNFRPH